MGKGLPPTPEYTIKVDWQGRVLSVHGEDQTPVTGFASDMILTAVRDKLNQKYPEPWYLYIMQQWAELPQWENEETGEVCCGQFPPLRWGRHKLLNPGRPLYKFGVSKSPRRRVKEVKASLWLEVRCRDRAEAYALEAGMHRALSPWQTDKMPGKEWFDFEEHSKKAARHLSFIREDGSYGPAQHDFEVEHIKRWAVDVYLARMSRYGWSRADAEQYLFGDERLRASEPTPQGG